MPLKYIAATLVALIAFAGNSVLCRLALGNGNIDATSFTIVRLVSGGLVLYLIVIGMSFFSPKHQIARQSANAKTASRSMLNLSRKRILSAVMLFVYAAGFSYAYIELDTGVGALVLFGCVQLTMISRSIYNKQHLLWQQWLGLFLAFSGLVYLIHSQQSLGDANVSLLGFILMIVAGMAWAMYTVLGQGSAYPILDTKTNFLISIPFCLLLVPIYLMLPFSISSEGLLLAVLSGAATSAIGYAIWYYALEGLNSVSAGVVQLLVPVIAAIGGAIWAAEAMTTPLILSQLVILGGIALVMFTRQKT